MNCNPERYFIIVCDAARYITGKTPRIFTILQNGQFKYAVNEKRLATLHDIITSNIESFKQWLIHSACVNDEENISYLEQQGVEVGFYAQGLKIRINECQLVELFGQWLLQQ